MVPDDSSMEMNQAALLTIYDTRTLCYVYTDMIQNLAQSLMIVLYIRLSYVLVCYNCVGRKLTLAAVYC